MVPSIAGSDYLSKGMTGVDLNYPGLGVRLLLTDRVAVEARGQYEAGTLVLGPRGYYYLLAARGTHVFIGAEADYGRYKGTDSLGSGFAGMLLAGAEVFVSRRFSVQFDFGPAYVYLADGGQRASVSGLEYVTNFGLNCYLNPGSAQATASAASPAPNASPAPAAVATPPVIDSEREYREGVSLYKAKDYDGASAKARRILEANPSNWRAWGILGNCDYARGDMAAALISYEKSLRINPDNPQLEAWVTDLRQKLGVGSHEGGSR